MAITQLMIELGERISFVQCLSGKGKNVRPEKSFLLPMEDGAYTDGQIADPAALGAYLAERLKEEGATAKSVSFVITSGRIATREVTLPAVKASRIAEIVNINAPDYFPVDMSGYYVTHSRLGTADGGQHRVMVYAAPLLLLKDYFALAEALGMKLLTIEYAGNAQRNLYRTINPAAAGNLFVYLNDNSSYLSFMNGDQLALQRTLPFGGGELVEDFLTAAGMSESQYLEGYRLLTDAQSAEQVHHAASSDDIRNVLHRLAMGIARSLDYFTSNFAHIPIDNIILTGPYAALIDLTETVSAATGRTTITIDNMPEAATHMSDVAELLPYINCSSAVIESADLRPPSLSQKKKREHDVRLLERSVAPGVLALLLLLALAAALSALSYFSHTEAVLENQALKNEIEALIPVRNTYNTYVLYQNGAAALQNISGSTVSPNDALLPFMEELERKLPSEIVTLSAAFTPESVMLNCTVPKLEDVTRVLVQLRSFNSISVINVSPITETVDVTDGSYVAFSVTCSYVPVTFIPKSFIGNSMDSEFSDVYAEYDAMMQGGY